MWRLSSKARTIAALTLLLFSSNLYAWIVEGLPVSLKKSLEEILEEESDPESTVEQFLQSEGYYLPSILIKKDRIIVTLGPAVRVTDVQITLSGDTTQDPKALVAILAQHYPLKKGQIFTHEKHEEGKQALLFALNQQGYPQAFLSQSTVQIQKKDKAVIILSINPGPLVHFGNITIASDTFKKDWLNRLSPIKEGQLYSADKVEALQRELIQTEYFRQVDVEPSFDEKNARMNIHVKTLPRLKSVQLGAGYGTDSGARARLGVQWPQLWQTGHRASLKTLFAQRRQDHSFVYRWPGSHPTTDYYSALIGYNELKPHAHLFRTQKFQFAHTKIGEQWERILSLAYEKEGFRTSKTAAYEIKELLVPKIQWTSHRRHRLMISLLGSIEGLCSPVSFMQLDVQAKQQLSLNSYVQLRTREQLTGTLTNQFHEIPLSHRLYAGGTQSLRGYTYRSLGPAQGGRHRALGSVELFVSPWESKARLFTFVDGGNAFNDSLDAKFSAGVGLGWQTPVGMLQIALAKPIRETGEWKFHLEING